MVVFVAGMAGCQVTEPNPLADDPVARAVGGYHSWEGHQHFDAGVIIIRNENVAPQYSCDDRMAFDVNNNPVQVNGSELNGNLLQWIPSETSIYNAQIYETQDSNAYGSVDSATFSYTGYDGETWNDKVEIAPVIGPLNAPDTVVVSQGLSITYQNPVPGDSISLSIIADGWVTKPPSGSFYYLDTSLADIGMITIPPNRLPNPAGNNSYLIQISRFHFITCVSPKGKIIGIYSEQDYSGGFDAKP